MSPNMPPMGMRAPTLFIDISAAPASCPKLFRENHARNSVARSESPHRIRPTHASHAVSSAAVISVNSSRERAGALGNMPTAEPKRATR